MTHEETGGSSEAACPTDHRFQLSAKEVPAELLNTAYLGLCLASRLMFDLAPSFLLLF